MRNVRLSGREATVVKAIGFAEPMLGSELLDRTRMEAEDITDALNGLLAAGFAECIPYRDQVEMAEMPVTSFEINPAYVQEIRQALVRR